MSGGGGYVISSRGLRQLVTIGFQDGECRHDGGDEDVEIGLCLAVSDLKYYFLAFKILLCLSTRV